MSFAAAFFDGTRPGLAGLANAAGRLFSNGPASHSELVFSDGWSGSAESGVGVRLKKIKYTSGKWYFITLPPALFDEGSARRWYDAHLGQPYDWAGCARFAVGGWLQDNKLGWYCSESNAAALQCRAPFRYCPNGLSDLLLDRIGDAAVVTRTPPL